jgi:hypothetical protein
VYDHGWQEAFRHKWIESEKHGRDLGQRAIDEWNQRHWTSFYRWCRLLHVTGRCCFHDFKREDFGRLTETDDDVAREVVRLFCVGKENVEIYWCAHVCGWPRERVFHVLLSLDINGSRLSPLVA